MEDYKKRMIEEYDQLKERKEKLGAMLLKHKEDKLDFKLSCPVELLQTQYNLMTGYLKVLELRSRIEEVDV